jgi:hypothetical protein
MDPAVIAASVGVGGTVIVGVVGFWSTKRAGDKAAQVATGNTIRTLDAARDDRIWDRRASAYEQGIAALLYRRQRRRKEWDELQEPLAPSTHRLYSFNLSLADQPYFDRYPPRGWFDAEGSLLAYATPKVIKALDAAREADDAARALLDSCQKLRPPIEIPLELSGEDSGASPEASMPIAEADAKFRVALEALEPMVRNAEQKDNDLINAIRDDLEARPSQRIIRSNYSIHDHD